MNEWIERKSKKFYDGSKTEWGVKVGIDISVRRLKGTLDTFQTLT